jgi:hypothetical protein
MLGIPEPGEDLLASQERLCSMELLTVFRIKSWAGTCAMHKDFVGET